MRQALELALEWIEKQPEETPHSKYDVDTRYVVIREIEAALAQPEQPKVRTGDCLLVGVCASEGHKIQAEQEPWRESASDYERGFIDGMQKQMQSSVDKAVNRMAQPDQDEVDIRSRLYQRIHELETQLAQPKQEPVAWLNKEKNTIIWDKIYPDMQPLYTTPPQHTWVGLTNGEFVEACQMAERGNYLVAFKRIQEKLKEKNT